MEDPRVQMQADLKEAMRAKDRQRITVIRMALNAIKQVEIDQRVELNAEDAMAILVREAKKRRESISEAESAGRAEIATSEAEELAIMEVYLPKQLSEDEIRSLVSAAIEQTGAASPKEMGMVMQALMPSVKGKADGKLVSQIVRELLA